MTAPDPATTRTIEALAAEAWGAPVRVETSEALLSYMGPNHVWRCTFASGQTAVAKQSRAGNLRDEWACLQLLAGIEALHGRVPHLLGGDAASGLLLMADLGASTQLGRLLLDPDHPADAAVDALLSAQRTVASMHAATLGMEERYRRIRSALGDAAASRHRIHGAASAVDALSRLPGAPAGIASERAAVLAALAAPSRLHGLTQGDFTPANIGVTERGVILVDFEAGGIRNVLMDGTYGLLRHLHSTWAARMPDAVCSALFAEYRTALLSQADLDSDEVDFASSACVTAWLAILMVQFDAVQAEDIQLGRTTWRQRISRGLAQTATVLTATGHLPAFAELAGRLLTRIELSWTPEERTLPLFPCFDETRCT